MPLLDARCITIEHGHAIKALVGVAMLDSEPEAVLRADDWCSPRLAMSRREPGQLHLSMRARGSFAALAVVELQPFADLLRHQVELRVWAVGLNFRDVLNVLGEYPGDPGPPGGDCAGVITAASDKVLRVDSPAFGVAFGSLASVVRGVAHLLVPMPPELSFERACTLPVTWSTAHAAFVAASCRVRHAVLLHAAAGGVGLTAAEYIAWLGAVAHGTSGQPYKHAALCADHVVSSCSFSRNAGAFTVGLARRLSGKRLHAVLNSLSADFTCASFMLLGDKGCFEEIGKRGVWSRKLTAAAATCSRFDVLAVDTEMLAGPNWFNSVLQLLARQVGDHVVHSLPLVTFAFARALQPAFRLLQRGNNVGKVVVRISQVPSVQRPRRAALLTGGTGGIGLLTARWLAETERHPHLVLASRSAVLSEGGLNQLLECGAAVSLRRCDAAEAGEVRSLLAMVQSEQLPPLCSVWHTAGLLTDRLLAQQDARVLHSAHGPKAGGAWQLHRAHIANPLHVCVYFSSIAGLVGSAGQANYAAANATLDTLASCRQEQGCATRSVGWGPWAEVGMAAGGAVKSRMAQWALG